jgi:hypothetical protein
LQVSSAPKKAETPGLDPARAQDPASPPFDDLEPDAAPLAVLQADSAATLDRDERRSEALRAAEEARATNTERDYAADRRDFPSFCASAAIIWRLSPRR